MKSLEFTSFAGTPMYLATLAEGETRVVPLQGPPQHEFDRARIIGDGSRPERQVSAD